MTALRFNNGKPQLSKLFEFGSALDKLVRVMTQGAIKYDDGNWLLGGQDVAQFLDSGQRHVRAYASGEDYDPDTGCHHLAHAAWNNLAALRILHDELPDLDPEFDQDEFVARYQDDSAHHEAEYEALTEDSIVEAMENAEVPDIIDGAGDRWVYYEDGTYRFQKNNGSWSTPYTREDIDYVWGVSE